MTPDPRNLEQELGALERELASQRDAARAASRVTTAVSLGLLVAVLGVVFFNYRTIESAWTGEDLQRSLRYHAEAVSPDVARAFGALAEDLAPVYGDEARRQFDALTPELERATMLELDAFSHDVTRVAHEKLEATEVRVREAASTALTDAYPELRDPAEKEAFLRRFHAVADEALASAVTEFDQRFVQEFEALQETVESIDVHDDADVPTPELQKRFLHLWLTLLDEELMKS